MEEAFGTDFADVRLHTGGHARRLTRAAGARALTRGNDIFLNSGAFQPYTVGGRRLLGHELTHVIQQRCGRVEAPAATIHADPALEQEANRAGERSAQGRPAVVRGSETGASATAEPGPFQPYFFRVPQEEDREISYANDYDPFAPKAFNLQYLGLRANKEKGGSTRGPSQLEEFKGSVDTSDPGIRSRSVHRSKQTVKKLGMYPGGIQESQDAVDLGQVLIDGMNEFGSQSLKGDLRDQGFMIGALKVAEGFVLASSGFPTEGFSGAVKKIRRDTKNVTEATFDPNPTDKEGNRSKEITLTSFGGEKFEVRQKPGSNLPGVCAAPKSFLHARRNELVPENLTEILYDPLGANPVVVHGTRYHHRERVPSCATCEVQLTKLLDGLGGWSRETLACKERDRQLRAEMEKREQQAREEELLREKKKRAGGIASVNPYDVLAVDEPSDPSEEDQEPVLPSLKGKSSDPSGEVQKGRQEPVRPSKNVSKKRKGKSKRSGGPASTASSRQAATQGSGFGVQLLRSVGLVVVLVGLIILLKTLWDYWFRGT